MKKIFEPIKIGNLELKNRMIVSAMVSNYCKHDGIATEQYTAYHERKAKGGWGLVITENYTIVPDGGGFVDIPGLWEDAQIPSHKKFTERVHKAGGKIVAQIYHAGRQTTKAISGSWPIAPSAVKDPTMPETPRELTVPEIEDLVEKFGDCALRVKKAGFDGVEIHGAHGYLINQFLSPFSNKRTDEYGGSTRNRAKFAIDVIKNVRGKVGDDFPIIFRMTVAEYVDGGLAIEESKSIAMMLEEAGIDAFHCTQGVYTTVNVILAPFTVPIANFINNAAEIKKVLKIPVIGVGKITNPDIAESIIASEKADIVTMARASLADPELPNKTKDGKFEDISYCVGCMQGCAGEEGRGYPVRCMVNPLTGMESQVTIEKTETPKKVIIVGGGVAGCEAAIIAAKRGHDVTIYEKQESFGGQFKAASVPTGKSGFSAFVAWQTNQMKKLGVKMITEKEVTVDLINEEKPDTVIIATGSAPNIPEIQGLNSVEYATAIDVLIGKKLYGSKVAVIGGGQVGAETAEFMGIHGAEVYLFEALSQIARDGEAGPVSLLKESLLKHGVKILTSSEVVKINKDKVYFIQNEIEEVITGINTVVISTGAKSFNTIATDKLNCEYVIIGDARCVQNGYRAIQEGFEAGLKV